MQFSYLYLVRDMQYKSALLQRKKSIEIRIHCPECSAFLSEFLMTILSFLMTIFFF